MEVVLHYAKWALEREQEQAARIFTERQEEETSEKLEPRFILDFLKPFQGATILYLEHLINDRKSMVQLPIQVYFTVPCSHLVC